jgi:NAD(P)-dependent dehydrogenase (short-subunit alcohol dehydrogenase family)
MPILDGKTTIITGAAGGIGAAAADVFAAHGSRLVLADTDTEGGEQVTAAVKENGGEAVFVRTDVTQEADVVAMVRVAIDTFGSLDCAFNNAGIDGVQAPLHQQSIEDWNAVLAVNLTGVWLCMKHQIQHMLTAGGGAIVNTASAAGLIGIDVQLTPYVAAKHGVVGLTRDAALAYATRHIRVNAICPGAVRTPMLTHAIEQGLITMDSAVALEPIRRLAEPAEMAEAAAWLCSDNASYITGQPLAVDGGMTAGLTLPHDHNSSQVP